MRRLALLLLTLFGLAAAPAAAWAQTPIHWTMAVTSKGPVMPGKGFEIGLTARIDKGWHLYALQEPNEGPPPTVLTIGDGPFSIGGTIAAPLAEKVVDPNFNNIETEFYLDEVTFIIPVRVAATARNGRTKLTIVANYVTCSDRICLPPKDDPTTIEINVGAADPGATVVPSGAAGAAIAGAGAGGAGAAGSGVTATTPATTTGSTTTPAGAPINSAIAPVAPGAGAPLAPAPVGPAIGISAPVTDMAASSRASTLGAYVGLAALMGALSLVTPCVFPMVPITVSYFTNRARKSRREAVTQALIYGLGIILTFTGVGFTLAIAFGASGLNRFAADPWLNLGVTAMFIAFAFSLFGVWELALPSKLVNAAAKADSGKGRLAGTLLMGLAFTLTSFTCTAPFLGTLLVVASQGDWQWPLAGMLAFSSVFALPFVILAFVPQMLASLPRSGPWLIAVKAVMGIVELAAAMKFLSNVDLVWGWNIFTRPVVLVTWVVLAVILVAYLAGLVKLGPVPKLRKPGIARWTAVAAGIVLGVWLASGLAGRRLGELEAFLPPAEMAHLGPKGELPWMKNDFDGALAKAKSGGQRVIVDFTGYTCTNCRWMEANMFPRPEVARELARYVRTSLYTDGRGEPYAGFQKMQEKLFGTVALPLYAVMTADGAPIVYFSGLTRDPNEFLMFLRKGLEGSQP